MIAEIIPQAYDAIGKGRTEKIPGWLQVRLR
jgi:hypothetical protein